MSKTQANTRVELEEKNFGQTGKFVRENQKSLLFIVAAVVIMAAGYYIYLKVYLAPREIIASNQMYVAQDFWEKKEWDKAINGDSGYPGFKKIISDYSNTKAANLAYYYLGTAYVELKDYDKAETYFKKAVDKAKNKFLSPLYLKKLGLVYEAENDNKDADETYKKIKTDYFTSPQAQNIDEYIARVEAKQ
jgi:predicted negative regulator of RcsB-dependent stress response